MEPTPLPSDLLLEIFYRSDPVAVVRCAAVCKPWRLLIAGNSSRFRRLADGRFLLGFLYQDLCLVTTLRFGRTPPSLRSFSQDAAVTDINFGDPIAFRDGLLVLQRRVGGDDLCVQHPISGVRSFVPRPAFDPRSYEVLITGCDLDKPTPSFQLLALHCDSRSPETLSHQTFSSESGAWGQVRSSGLGQNDVIMHWRTSVFHCGAVHWLCSERSGDASDHMLKYTVTLDVAAGETWRTKLPAHCRVRSSDASGLAFSQGTGPDVRLAAWEDGRLTLLRAARCMHLFVWVHDDGAGRGGAASWTLWHSVDMLRLAAEAGLAEAYMTWTGVVVICLCPRSGCVLLKVPGYGIAVLDLGRKRIKSVVRDGFLVQTWPCEVAWPSCLSTMKTFSK